MRAYGLSESLVLRKTGGVDRLQVERHEPLALLIGDLQMSVDIDDVLKAQFAGESVGPSERFCGEPGQVVDMMRSPLGEHCAQDRIGEDLRVEQLFEAMQRLFPAGMLE